MTDPEGPMTNRGDGHITVTIHMEEGRPILARTFSQHIAAQVRVLELIDKKLNGKKTLEWYLAGFDMQTNGVAYQLLPMPKGYEVRIESLTDSAPSLVNPPTETVSNGDRDD